MALLCCYVLLPNGKRIDWTHPGYSGVIHSNNPHIVCPGPIPFPLPLPPPGKEL